MSTSKTSYTYTASMCVQLKFPFPDPKYLKAKMQESHGTVVFPQCQSVPEVLQHIHLWKFFHVPQMEEAFQEMQQDEGTNFANKSDEKK